MLPLFVTVSECIFTSNCIFTLLCRQYEQSVIFFVCALVLLSNQRTLQNGKQDHYVNKRIHACTRACMSSGFRAINKQQKIQANGHLLFCDQALDSWLFSFSFSFSVFCFFPSTGSSPPPHLRQPQETRGQGHNYFAIFPPKKNRPPS